MRDHIVNLWKSWDDAEAKQIASMNLFLDAPIAQRRAEIQKLKDEVGECSAVGPVIPENWLRGQFNLTCRKGTVGVFYTLSPTQPPAVQYLAFRKIDSGAYGSARQPAPQPASPVPSRRNSKLLHHVNDRENLSIRKRDGYPLPLFVPFEGVKRNARQRRAHFQAAEPGALRRVFAVLQDQAPQTLASPFGMHEDGPDLRRFRGRIQQAFLLWGP